MNLRTRIEELERKFPEIREMEAYCLFDDGHSEWLTLDALKSILTKFSCSISATVHCLALIGGCRS